MKPISLSPKKNKMLKMYKYKTAQLLQKHLPRSKEACMVDHPTLHRPWS